MKICMIAYTHYPTDSRVRREAEALAVRGDDVDFICLGDKNSPKQETFYGVTLIKIRHNRYRGGNTAQYLLSYIKFFLAAFFQVTALYFQKRYSIIQVHTMPDFMVFAAIIPRILGARIILDVHDLMPELYQSKFGYSEDHPVIKMLIWIERASIWFCHRAIAVHQPHLDVLCSHGNPRDKFIQLLNLPDEKIYQNQQMDIDQIPTTDFQLVYHGTISKRHGLDIAVRAISKLTSQIPNLHLEITGAGDGIDQIEALTVELQLENAIQINNGMVPMEELVPKLKQADIGIVPLILDDFTQYMLPVKLLEYVSLEIPVICTRTKTIETYFDDTMVTYFTSGNIDELAKCIVTLYQNPERRIKQASLASQFLNQYNWNRQKELYYQLIDSLGI